MQIVAISPSRQSSKVWLKFDDQSFIPFKIDDIVILKLKKFVDISDDLYQQILKSSVNFVLFEYAIRQITISPKVEAILRQKIKIYCQKIAQKYGYSSQILSEQIELVIKKINQEGLLDEQKYVEYLVRKYPKKSISELNYKLKSYGICQTITVNSQSEVDKIKAIIQKKYRVVDLSDYNDKNKLIGKLYRKGFPLELIKNAIDELSNVR